jgi:hypothetical protein
MHRRAVVRFAKLRPSDLTSRDAHVHVHHWTSTKTQRVLIFMTDVLVILRITRDESSVYQRSVTMGPARKPEDTL